MATMNAASDITKADVTTPVVSSTEWVAARKELLRKEKEFSRLRDKLSRQRPLFRSSGWGRITFSKGPEARKLSQLFGNKSQLKWFITSCSGQDGRRLPRLFFRQYFDGPRSTWRSAMRALWPFPAPLCPKSKPSKNAWNGSSSGSPRFGADFNFDYQVSASKEEKASGKVFYNYETTNYFAEELPGMSVFYKNNSGEIFHTYSSYARGLDPLLSAYNWLDLTPKGRDEDGLAFSMAWVRHHDKYNDHQGVDPTRPMYSQRRPMWMLFRQRARLSAMQAVVRI